MCLLTLENGYLLCVWGMGTLVCLFLCFEYGYLVCVCSFLSVGTWCVFLLKCRYLVCVCSS